MASSQEVKFFLKKNAKGEKIVHSIFHSLTSAKYVFPPCYRKPEVHLPGVREKVLNAQFKTRAHISFTLINDEILFYVNSETNDFWFNGNELVKVPLSSISNKISNDVLSEEEEEVSQFNLKKRQRGSYVNFQQQTNNKSQIIQDSNSSLVKRTLPSCMKQVNAIGCVIRRPKISGNEQIDCQVENAKWSAAPILDRPLPLIHLTSFKGTF